MQPLTPNERREIEKVKKSIFESESFIIETFENDRIVYAIDSEFDSELKDLWLKVLSMALEHNDKLSDEWRNKR